MTGSPARSEPPRGSASREASEADERTTLDWNPAAWIAQARQYLIDVRSEFRKITWPNQREYVGGTVGVVVIVAFLTLVLGLIDAGLAKVMELVVG